MAADKVLMTVTGRSHAPSLGEAASQLGLAASKLDFDFGVVPIDPDRGLYAVQVQADQPSPGSDEKPYSGPFSNPRIEPFGPIQAPHRGER